MANEPPIPANVDAAITQIRNIFSPGDMDNASNFAPIDADFLQNIGYDIDDPQIPFWEAQFRLNIDTQTTTHSSVNFPAVQHNLPVFLEERGANSDDIVNERGLRMLLSNHSAQEVQSFINKLQEFPVRMEMLVTVGGRFKSRMIDFGTIVGSACSRLPGLRDIVVSSTNTSYPYPEWDPTAEHESFLRYGIRMPDTNISVTHRSGVNEDLSLRDSRFAVLVAEAKGGAAAKVTPGLHLYGPNNRYCRQGTDDSAVISRLGGRLRAVHSMRAAAKNFKETATQVLEGAIMNKCRSVVVTDPGGLSVFLLDDRLPDLTMWRNRMRAGRGGGGGGRGGRGGDRGGGRGGREGSVSRRQRIGDGENDGIDPIQVNYRAAYCHHLEDGTYWFPLLCAFANNLFADLPGLEARVQQHGESIRNGQQPVYQPGQFQAFQRSNLRHQLAHSLYTSYSNIYHFNLSEHIDEVLGEFGRRARRNRRFDQFKVCNVIKARGNDYSPAQVYQVVHESINRRKPVILKVLPPENGEALFLNEVDVYSYLKTMSGTREKVWPRLFEFGSLSIEGGGEMYYLLLEYIAGERPTMAECYGCAEQLWNLGVDHRDVDPRNFIKTPAQKVIAFDFGLSKIASE